MKIKDFDIMQKVMVVAEIGNNHEGDYSLAEEMIGLAASAGADAVKFQTFRTEHYVGSDNLERYEMLKSFELEYQEFEKLKEYADKNGVIFLSTPFDIGSAEFLNSIVPAFKIASGDNSFYPLIETIARLAKPVLLSCGIAGITEIGYTKLLIERIWNEIGVFPGLAVLHCVSSYPVSRPEANLKAIQTLQKTLNCAVGYSDHTLGIEAAVLSVALGARIVEKHFTKDKDFSDFRDHQLSADTKDLKILVDRIREVEEMLGTGIKEVQDCEKKIEPLVRRSIVAARNISAGEIVRLEDITWVRPAGGIPPGREELIIGKTLIQDVAVGQWIIPEIVD